MRRAPISACRSVPGGGGASRGPMSVLRNWLLNVLGMLSLVPVRLATSRTRAWGAIAPSDLGPDAGEYGAVMQVGERGASAERACARKIQRNLGASGQDTWAKEPRGVGGRKPYWTVVRNTNFQALKIESVACCA